MRVVDKGFSCKDPRGVEVTCSKQQWDYLIKHKEMVGQQGVVKVIIEKPDFINQSSRSGSRNTYYKRLVLPNIGSTYIRVVIDIKEKESGIKKGYVINAFATDGPQKGERLLWERNK